MNNLKWMGHTATVMEMQKNLRQDTQTCDVLICANESTMQAHRFILCACSDYFRDIFRDVPMDDETTIIIPDLKSNILERVLTFIYLGEVCVNSSQLSDFLESINFLGIKSPISFECHLNKEEKNLEDDSNNNEDKEIVQHDDDGSTATDACGSKDFEYLEVYNDDEKIDQYSIENIEPETNSDYIIENPPNTSTFNINEVKESNITFKNTETDITSGPTVEQLNFAKVETESNEDNKTKDEMDINELTQSRNESLESAVKAVIDDGMSLQKAASTYQISKTVLWRRVKKNPYYKMKGNPVIEAAIQKLAQGETLKSVSKALDIPLSTLHRHKMKMFHEGRLPDNILIRRKESRESLKFRLTNAVKACQEGMSQNHASSVFGVPKSTLWRHLKKMSGTGTGMKIETITIGKDDNQLIVDDDDDDDDMSFSS